MDFSSNRDVCYRCLKARVMCYCAELRPFESDPEIIILIHEKESRKAINTGRMAHLSIRNSRLLKGHDFTDDPRLNSLLADESRQCYLLFPGEAAIDLKDLPSGRESPPKIEVFIILDATWSMAKKMFRASRNLHMIPQVMFKPSAPSEFSIRQQPGEHCYSTIETVHHILKSRGSLSLAEGQNLLDIFRAMVRKQEEYESCNPSNSNR